MTVQEVANIYGTKSMNPSSGQTITSLTRQLYESDKDIFANILKKLNHRTDWFNLDPEVQIKYLKPASVKYITE